MLRPALFVRCSRSIRLAEKGGEWNGCQRQHRASCTGLPGPARDKLDKDEMSPTQTVVLLLDFAGGTK